MQYVRILLSLFVSSIVAAAAKRPVASSIAPHPRISSVRTLENEYLKVDVDEVKGLVRINGTTTFEAFDITENNIFNVTILYLARNESAVFNATTCTASKNPVVSSSSVVLSFRCATFARKEEPSVTFWVGVNYTLTRHFVSKTLRIGNSCPYSDVDAAFVVASCELWSGLTAKIDGGQYVDDEIFTRSNPWNSYDIASFLRFRPSTQGLFVAVANPFATIPATLPVHAGYLANHLHSPDSFVPEFYESESAIVGLTQLSKYYFADSGVNTGERRSFVGCVNEYLLDRTSRENRSVKVNVAWDENDYQIDVGSAAGVEEYKRIIDRNAQFGVTHIVYEPRNTLHASRFNSTDGWGWEASLWFSLGEAIREGTWSPKREASEVPSDILAMVAYAKQKDIKLLAYVYPCLLFQEMSEYWLDGALDLSSPRASRWLSETLLAFANRTYAGGFAFDHDIFAGDSSKQYSQWRSWMWILKNLRDAFPDIVMDHRQTNHMWGPWYQLAGSYAEPIAGDENPETYGVPLNSLHTDHVAANNMRIVNRVYATQQLLPPSRIPGFIFHQTERTADNGTNSCFGSEVICFDANTRDFDLLGYKYSLMSTIGTAGSNLVFTMIPARDPEEFELLPPNDLKFVRDWVAWTDEHIEYLQRTEPIPTLSSGPTFRKVDGTSAMFRDEGYLFFFNPNPLKKTLDLTVDESLGITNASAGALWTVSELLPAKSPIGTWSHGESVRVNVSGWSVTVLELKKRQQQDASVARCGGVVQEIPSRTIGTLPPSNNTGGSFTFDFSIGVSIRQQLDDRAKTYPVEWQPSEWNATWLVPTRLIANIFVENPEDSWNVTASVDENPVEVRRSYNSRGLVRSRCFLGFYVDCTHLLNETSASHVLTINLPANLSSGAFQGAFWHNIEPTYASKSWGCGE